MEERRPVAYNRLISEESTISSESWEDYQTDIYEQLPSSQKRLPNKDQAHEAETHWNPNQPLKILPLCIQEKRNLRDKRHLRSYRIGYWESWKQSQEIARRRLREHLGRFVSGLLPWKSTLHNIEGRFGVGVKAYFVFLRYLLGVNILNLVIISGFVLSPDLYGKITNNHTDCFQHFTSNFSLLDIILGSGFMEYSPVFYGFYTNYSFGQKCFNSALLFFSGMLILLLLNLIMIVHRTVVGYKNTWLTGMTFNANMSYKVFCGWDFCIKEPGAALLKHSLVRNELKMDLEEQKFRQKVLERSLKKWILLYTLRIVLNFVVLVLLGGSFYLIYLATEISVNHTMKDYSGWISSLLNLLIVYCPPLIMTVANFVMPRIFSAISLYEDYSLTTQLNVILVRSILLKLGCLGIYLFFLIRKLIESNKFECPDTEFGKEMYKLTIFHLMASFCNTFLVAYPRKLLVENCFSCNLFRKVGKQQFVIPLNVLDLVYSQTVTWVGVFYCPLLPAISMVKLLVLFYISKFNLVRCCDPAKKMFRTSSSSVMFHFVLLVGLIMSAVTLGVNIKLFKSCGKGPFGTETMSSVYKICTGSLPHAANKGISYTTSEAFACMLILMEIIILTSYLSRVRTNKKAMVRLKDMLVMCSSDKRYLVKHHATLLRRKKRMVNYSRMVELNQ